MSKQLLPTDEDIKEEAADFAIGYNPLEDTCTPQEYAQYGFEMGMKMLRDKLEYIFITRGIK